MRSVFTLNICILLSFILPSISFANCDGLLDFESKKLHSTQSVDFCASFKDKTLLIVNTASQCGFTPQFKELEALYQKYKGRGLEIIGFPSNDFRQEYQSEEKTASVCFKNFGVSFTMLSPSSVKGKNRNAFFQILADRTGTEPNWNFNKYFVSRDHKFIEHYGSSVQPLDSSLERLIANSINTH